jgi:hypothetical protein
MHPSIILLENIPIINVEIYIQPVAFCYNPLNMRLAPYFTIVK